MQEYIELGKLGKAHGIKGWILIHSFSSPPEQIFSYSQFFILKNKSWQPIEVEHYKCHSNKLLLKIKDINTPESAKCLTNLPIGIHKESLAPTQEDEYYFQDLIGLKVINRSNEVLGTVTEVFDTVSNDVFVVVGDKRHLIPHVNGIVDSIDLNTQTIRVDWDKDF